MKDYIITEKAGRIVANRVNTGVGTILWMTEEEAAAAVEAGALVPVPEPVEEPEPDAAPADVPDLLDMNKAQLLALAEARGVAVDAKATKAEIAAALAPAQDAPGNP